MLSKDRKTYALDSVIFKVGEIVVHKRMGYTGKIVRLNKYSAIIEIAPTLDNFLIWENVTHKQIKVTNIAKHFKHEIYASTINL